MDDGRWQHSAENRFLPIPKGITCLAKVSVGVVEGGVYRVGSAVYFAANAVTTSQLNWRNL